MDKIQGIARRFVQRDDLNPAGQHFFRIAPYGQAHNNVFKFPMGLLSQCGNAFFHPPGAEGMQQVHNTQPAVFSIFFDHVRCSACPCHGLYSAQSGTAARTPGPPGTCPISGIRCCRPCPGVSQFTQDRLYAGALSEIIFPRNCRAPGRRSCCSEQVVPTSSHRQNPKLSLGSRDHQKGKNAQLNGFMMFKFAIFEKSSTSLVIKQRSFKIAVEAIIASGNLIRLFFRI